LRLWKNCTEQRKPEDDAYRELRNHISEAFRRLSKLRAGATLQAYRLKGRHAQSSSAAFEMEFD
jgi:hypothetical protein